MQPTDMRSLSPQARRERRVQVVRLRADGHTYGEVAALTGVSRTGVFDICHRVQSAGGRTLDNQRNNDFDSRRRTLDGPLSTEIRKLITTHLPDRLSLPYTLWTNVAVAQLVHQRFGVPISVRNTALHVARWGFKPHSPLRKEQQSTTLATALWLKGTYPAIKIQAASEDAEICWADASLLHSQDGQAASGYSVFSTVNNKGQMHWAAYAGALDAGTLIDSLRRRVQEASKKILLMLDPSLVHDEGTVVDWLAGQEDAIEVFHLPVRSSSSLPVD